MEHYKDGSKELVLSNSAITTRAGYQIIDPLFASAALGTTGLREYGRMIVRHKLGIASAAILCALTGVLISLPQAPVYRAHTAIEVEGPNESSSNWKDLDPTSTVNSGPTQPNTEAQARTLRDGALIESTLISLNLSKHPASVIQPGKLAGLFGNSTPDQLAHDELVRATSKRLTVDVSAEQPIIDVYFDATDPRIAADFLNKLIENLTLQNLESRRKSAQQLHIWLSGELKAQKETLEASSNALQAYARANGLINGEAGVTLPEARLRQSQEVLSRARADRAAKQSRFEEAQSVATDALPEVLDNPVLREYHVKLTDLRRQLAESNLVFQSNYPKVSGLQAQEAELNETIRKETLSIVRRIGNEYRAAVRDEQLLAKNYAAEAKIVSDQALIDAHYSLLKREVDANRSLYDTMLQKIKVASVISAMQASNIRILSPARPPAEAYTPRPVFNALMGLVAGSFLSMGFIFVREQTDRSLKRPGDTARYLSIPELGLIPSFIASASSSEKRYHQSPNAGTRKPGSSHRALLRRLGARLALTHHTGSENIALATWYDQSSALAEAMRIVISSLWLRRTGSTRPRIIVFASARSGDGKTTLASNIAIALAESCQVLLIDGDLRQPSLHRIFGISNSNGLGEILSSTAEIPEASERAIVKTHIPQLSVLPSGSTTVRVGSLRYYQRLEKLFQHARNTFDAVLVDTPPVLGVVDARIFGRVSDVVVFVLRAAETTRDEASAALSNFQDDGTPVIGAVLNYWNPRQFSYGDVGSYCYHKSVVTDF
jgi:polysaccharide biosynthesis transport protein